MILLDPVLTYDGDPIPVDKAFLLESDAFATDFVLAYRHAGRYACLAVDGEDVGGGRIEAEDLDGRFAMTYSGEAPSDGEEDILSEVAASAAMACLAKGHSNPLEVQMVAMLAIHRHRYRGDVA